MLLKPVKAAGLTDEEVKLLSDIVRIDNGVKVIDDISIRRADPTKFDKYMEIAKKIFDDRRVSILEGMFYLSNIFIHIEGFKAKCFLAAPYRYRLMDNLDLFRYTITYYNPKTNKLEDRTLSMFTTKPPIKLWNKEYIVFETYRGLLPRLFKLIKFSPSSYIYRDIPSPPPSSLRFLYPYQREVVLDVFKYFRCCGCSTIMIATGGGKTEIALAIIKHISSLDNKPIFILSLNKLLIRQFIERGKKYNLDIGEVSGDKFEIDKQILASTVQTLYGSLSMIYKLKRSKSEDRELHSLGIDSRLSKDESYRLSRNDIMKLVNKFRNSSLIVFDEAQHIPAYIVKNSLRYSPNSLRLGLSATPWRDDGRSLEIYAYIGDIVSRVNFEQLWRAGVCVPASIKFIIYTPLYYKKYYNLMGRVPSNKLWDMVSRQVALDLKRYYIAADYIVKADKPILILVKYIGEGLMLSKILNEVYEFPTKFIYSKSNVEHRMRAIDDLVLGRINALIATSIADEGLDIPQLRSLFLFHPVKSSTRIIQRVGRVVRFYDNKLRGYVYDFVDMLPYLWQHYLVRKNAYKSQKVWSIEEEKAKEPSMIVPIKFDISEYISTTDIVEPTAALAPPDIEEKILEKNIGGE